MIYDSLYPWQKQIVDRFSARRNFGLFLKMGLGKTPLSLAFAEKNECKKIIIITINSKAIEDETQSGSWFYWLKRSKFDYELHNKWNDVPYGSTDALLVNYEGLYSRKRDRAKKIVLKQNIEEFIQSCYGHNCAIIVDESHKMKNLHSMQTQAINEIKRRLRMRCQNVYTYLLTGTPFTTGYIDLYSQLKMLGYPDTKTSFVNQFCELGHIPGLLGWQQPIVGYKNIDRLFDLIHQYAITIETKDVVQLPEQIFIEHPIRWSRDFTMFTQEFATGQEIAETFKFHKIRPSEKYLPKKQNNPFFRNIAYPDLKWIAQTSGTFWLRARQLSIGFQGNAEESIWYDHRRLNELRTLLEEQPDNYLIFYNFTPELLEIYNICEQLGYNIDVYSGDIKSTIFYDIYANQSPAKQVTNKKNVLIANFASGSTGMNWQAYNSCIIFSIPLFKDYEQGIARIHRLGQTRVTIYHIFYQKNWLDEKMLKALETQTTYSNDMFESDLKRVQNVLEETK